MIAIDSPRRIEGLFQIAKAAIAHGSLQQREKAHLPEIIRRSDEFFQVTEIVQRERQTIGVRLGAPALGQQ
jgi:hypothetical protein